MAKQYPAGIVLIITILIALWLVPAYSQADTADYDIPNGHFYTEAAGSGVPAGAGYMISDEGTDSRGQTIRFWSEFKRLGGVEKLGYPASRRFIWNGFVCQVTQRVVLQWHPETNSVAFLNVMDLITQASKDDYLLVARQTPRPADFGVAEQGLSFQQIVAKRYALLDANPAIKARYFSVSDPLALNGLPTAPITDMGDAYVLRAQRIIIQQWKKDMPWAKAGDVTVALGGDIAKEVGLVATQSSYAGIPASLQDLLAGVTPATPTPTVPPAPANIWKISEFRQLSACENHGMHNLFVEVYDANGAPLNGIPIVFEGNTQKYVAVTGDKGPGHTEFDLERDGGIAYVQGGQSDVTPVFTTNMNRSEICPTGGAGNTWFHFSFKVVFKRTY